MKICASFNKLRYYHQTPITVFYKTHIIVFYHQREITLEQGSQTQITPWATWGFTRQPTGRIMTLTQQ